jgi:hypothetical protein
VPGHVHTGGVQFLIFGISILIWMAIFRILEIWLHGNAIGRGLAFIA